MQQAADATEQARTIMDRHGGIELMGHPWRLYNGIYMYGGQQIEGFPVYNNSHGKFLYHPLPEGWQEIQPQEQATGAKLAIVTISTECYRKV